MELTVRNDNYQLDQKYRPQTVDEIVLPKSYKRAFKNYIKKGELPHLLFHSLQPGTGKTTTARAIVNDMGLDPNYDYLFLKGDNVNVNFIKNELYEFCVNASPTGKRRVVIIDEYDRPTLGEAQRLMRTTIDEFSNSVSFIITANDPHNIHEALRNRMHSYNFGDIPEDEVTELKSEYYNRLKKICELENIEVKDERVLKYLVHINFPYMRTCLTQLSKYAFANDYVLDTAVVAQFMSKSGEDTISILKEEIINRDKLYAIAKKETYNASMFIDKLYNDLTKEIEPVSQIDLIQIIGEMNKTFGLAVNKEFHLYYLLIQIATKMRWK